jgi:hypothetical protein
LLDTVRKYGDGVVETTVHVNLRRAIAAFWSMIASSFT